MSPSPARRNVQRLLLAALAVCSVSLAGSAASALADATPRQTAVPGAGLAGPEFRQACGAGDADCDAIPDAQDACPSQPGPASHNGCPPPTDSDGDGLVAPDDACPTEAGTYGAKGCPDGDADGVADSEDACPTAKGEAGTKGCPDDDRDGVADSGDQCAHTNPTSEKPIDAQGCGPFRATSTLFARSTQEMQDDPDVHGQCENPKGKRCTFHMTLTLNKASAIRLGIGRKIMDVTLKTDKSTFGGKYVYDTGSGGLKRAVVRAFKRAYDRNIPVTMTFTGSYVLGSADAVAFPKSTFTMKRKPPGGTAYRIQPAVSNGPAGPSATGLTRPKISGDS